MRAFAIALMAFAVTVPAVAQTPTPASSEDDLKCAAWAAVVIGINKDKPEVVSKLTSGLTWFLARYEGATGKTFEQGLTADYLAHLGPDLAKVEEGCKARIAQVGIRLQSWGRSLQAADPAAKQATPSK